VPAAVSWRWPAAVKSLFAGSKLSPTDAKRRRARARAAQLAASVGFVSALRWAAWIWSVRRLVAASSPPPLPLLPVMASTMPPDRPEEPMLKPTKPTNMSSASPR